VTTDHTRAGSNDAVPPLSDDVDLPAGDGMEADSTAVGVVVPEPAAATESSPDAARTKRKNLPIWQETILLLGTALVLAIVIKALFVQAFYIPSESMEPGLVQDDRILVQKVSYWFGGSPERGDVVVFKDPGGWLSPTENVGPGNPLTEVMAKIGLYPSGGHLVKRVIGVAGDTIECCDDQGRLIVNGTPVEETDYLRDEDLECNGPMPSGCESDWTVGPIPEGTIFVMGDNRANSADSSVHMECVNGQATECTDSPFVDSDLVVGKVLVLVWPRDRFGWVHRPDSFADIPDAS
jgi:signal peptidase I